MKSLYLLLAVAFVFTATVRAEEPVALFYEPFSTQYGEHTVLDMTTDTELKANTILGTDAYKVDGNYYFNGEEDKLRLFNCDILNNCSWEDTELWPGASKGGVGWLNATLFGPDDPVNFPIYRAKLTTKDFQEAYFSGAYLATGWFNSVSFYYSFDKGANWIEFSKLNADVIGEEYGWRHYTFKENIGAQEMVYLKAESLGESACDDFKVTGYGPIGVEEAEAASFSAYRQSEGIVVRGVSEGEVIAVYNSAGIEVATAATNKPETCIQLQTKGLYIIKAGNKAVKAMW